MNGTTPKERAASLNRVLKSLYDDEEKGPNNVIDMLTDLRHLCDVKGWSFENCDRIAKGHYAPEKQSNTVEC